jgi:hypothetical protein
MTAMRYAEFRKADAQLRGRLAHANPTLFFLIEVPQFAASMALGLVIADMLPWDVDLWRSEPFTRLLFILAWAIAMAFWHCWLMLRAAPIEGTRG